MPATSEHDSVLGTNAAEIERLRLQHGVWRADAALAWRRAGFAPGHTILDVGCGPGFAALELADIMGRDGRVIAIDQSRRFLDHLRAQCEARRLSNVSSRSTISPAMRSMMCRPTGPGSAGFSRSCRILAASCAGSPTP